MSLRLESLGSYVLKPEAFPVSESLKKADFLIFSFIFTRFRIYVFYVTIDHLGNQAFTLFILIDKKTKVALYDLDEPQAKEIS